MQLYLKQTEKKKTRQRKIITKSTFTMLLIIPVHWGFVCLFVYLFVFEKLFTVILPEGSL